MKMIASLIWCLLYLGYAHASGLLYPHMAGNGDEECVPSREDDDFMQYHLQCDYTFYGIVYNTVFVGTNGYVTFDVGQIEYYPQSMFGVSGWPSAMIAPLFSDNYLENTQPPSHIWCRETNDPELLERFNNDINGYFEKCYGPCFNATWLFIVTWQRVESYCSFMPDWPDCWWPYGRSTADRPEKPSREQRLNMKKQEDVAMVSDDREIHGINGYQLVLATDHEMTFAMFNMHTIEWDCCWDYNESGFAAGDSMRACALPGSGSPDVVQLTVESNVGKPGRWIHRVDKGAMIRPDCSECTCGCSDCGCEDY